MTFLRDLFTLGPRQSMVLRRRHQSAMQIRHTPEASQPDGLAGMSEDDDARQVRSIFISDLHLGTRGAQADLVLEFLRAYDAPQIYLVGDIIDGWRLKNGWYFPQSHNDVIQKLLRKVRKGSKLIYITGNHDDFLRDFAGTQFGGITLVDDAIHETADGRRLLVIHGDLFDLVVRNAKWLALLGDWA